MLKRILLAYDGSDYSESAKTYALNLAEAHGSHLAGIYVIDQGLLSGPRIAVPGPTFMPVEVVSYDDYKQAQEDLRAKGVAYLEALGAAAKGRGVDYESLLRIGYPDQVILREARSYDLIVIGRKGKSDLVDQSLGYTGEMLAHNSAVPILMAPKTHAPIARCLLAYDGSQVAVRAMRSLRQVLEGPNWPVTVLVVREKGRTSESTAREAEDYLTAHGITVETKVADGEPAKAILDAVETSGANILAMGCFGHRGFREFFWGGTTTKVLAQAKVAVLVAH